MKFKISKEEISQFLDLESPEFPKYVSPLINFLNQYAQGTRPKIVGQMSDLMNEFGGGGFDEWEKWYLVKHPNAIRDATDKIMAKLQDIKLAFDRIDRPLVESWVRDLVLIKTYAGLRFQEAILRRCSELLGKPYKVATAEEEAKGIDGYIGDRPISIKPTTYDLRSSLQESLPSAVIFYEKLKDGISVDASRLAGR